MKGFDGIEMHGAKIKKKINPNPWRPSVTGYSYLQQAEIRWSPEGQIDG